MAYRTWTAVAACALVATMLPAQTSAASPSAPGTAREAAATPRQQTAALDKQPVTRLIVRMADSGGITPAVAAAAARSAGVDRALASRRLSGGAQLLLLSSPVSLPTARGLARSLQARPDVAAAEPDVLLTTADASPVVPDDPSFGQQWALWDDAAVAGGYGTLAPQVWPRSKGSRQVVVAVVDTGITKHPDLDANMVPGYDFVSLDDVAPFAGTNLQPLTANDGDGRDADASDPGNWISESEATGLGFFGDRPECGAVASNWHGTHVAGIVGAVQGNGVGISGVAPGVRIQPVRAVGKCGGYLSDVADAIRWSAGGTVPGAPANPTPADVINLSLGGPGTCAADGYLQSAVAYAVGAGATVVAAAGNGGADGVGDPVAGAGTTAGSLPANCTGVVAVSAVARDGSRAAYSNYGPEVDLAAPGGEIGDATASVLSTVNTGLTKPTAPGYRALAGTSMAAPHVAAAAALLQSSRAGRTAYTPEEVLAELQSMVQPFPTDSGCTEATPCGAGILSLPQDLAALPPLPVPSGTAEPRDRAVHLTWLASPDAGAAGEITYEISAGASGDALSPVGTTTATSFEVTGLVNGADYGFSVVARNSAGLDSPATDLGSAAPLPDGEVLPSAPTGLASVPRALGMTVNWNPSTVPAAASPVARYDVQYRLAGDLRWIGSGADTTEWALDTSLVTKVDKGSYEVRVRGANEQGLYGPWSSVLTVSVLARSTAITLTGSTVRPFVDGYQDSIGIRVTSNLAGYVALELIPGTDPAGVVARSWRPPASGPWSVSFNGRTAAGKALANGRYTVRVRQWNPLDGRFDTAASRAVYIRSSQVRAPEAATSIPTVYWYADGYSDSMSILSKTSVPATQTWRLTNSTGTYTFRRWNFDTSRSASVRWAGWGTTSRLPSGTYYLRVTAQGGEGSARTTVVKVSVSSKKLQKARFTRTVFPGSVAVTALNPKAGPPVFTESTFDGITRKVLRVYGGYSASTRTGTYDVLALSAALPSSVLPHTGVSVSTCLRAQSASWSPPGTNLLGGGYMSSSTRFAGWFSALLDEGGEGQFTLEPGFIACLRPDLPTPASAVAGGRVRWSLFNWAASSTANVPVYSFTITGYRYYLA